MNLLERWQIPIYLVALLAGGTVGLLVPAAARTDTAVAPLLIALLYATFLAVPVASIRQALRDRRFLIGITGLNFVVVPVVVFALSRVVASDEAVLVGVVLVLVAPCIDYVIVFSGLAGGASDRLLATAPIVMALQTALLPAYLWWFVGPGAAALIDVAPFLEAFVLFIAVPLVLAAVTQSLARRRRIDRPATRATAGAMVPLMAATLAVVVTSQIGAVRDEITRVLPAAGIFAAYLVVMAVVGTVVARAALDDVPSRRALVFSGATRNSLVVLPLALALPPALALAPVVVVTQTLVELVGMVIYVRVIPRLIPRA